MKFRSNQKITSWLLCMMLIVAMAFMATGCNTKQQKEGNQLTTEAQKTQEIKETVLGEGQTTFSFIVVDREGNEEKFEIHTDKETVAEALLEVDLIAGDEGAYGLYIKTVNGITADYDTDKTYWAFYVNGEYATSGVDLTKIEEGMTYTLKIEK